MTIFFCPHCDTRITVGFDVTDFVHDCTQSFKSEAVKEDDVVVTGDWEDFSGSGTKAPQEVMRQGLANEFFGRRPDIEGEDKEDLTQRGARESTHRQRPHLEFINVDEVRRR